MAQRILVNHFYAHNVGHAIEALHYAHGHWRADPSREVDVLLAAATPVELAGWAPWVRAAHAVDHPLLQRCADSLDRLRDVPRAWDWILDDPRRHQDWQHDLFPGLTDFYAASDEWLAARVARTVEGHGECAYDQAPWRLRLPQAARTRARRALDAAATAQRRGSHAHDGAGAGPPADGSGPTVALMPAGSGAAVQYPAAATWTLVLDALREALGDGLRVVLVGRRPGGARTATSVAEPDHALLAGHLPATVDAFDLPLADQLALVEACDVFLSPHTGFGLAALAVGTPWLTLSGGMFFEYFFNGVPFRSILPRPEHRTARLGSLDPDVVRTTPTERDPGMTAERVRADLDRIVAAATELAAGTLPYERALAEYFAELADVVAPADIWSIDGVHEPWVWGSTDTHEPA